MMICDKKESKKARKKHGFGLKNEPQTNELNESNCKSVEVLRKGF